MMNDSIRNAVLDKKKVKEFQNWRGEKLTE